MTKPNSTRCAQKRQIKGTQTRLARRCQAPTVQNAPAGPCNVDGIAVARALEIEVQTLDVTVLRSRLQFSQGLLQSLQTLLVEEIWQNLDRIQLQLHLRAYVDPFVFCCLDDIAPSTRKELPIFRRNRLGL